MNQKNKNTEMGANGSFAQNAIVRSTSINESCRLVSTLVVETPFLEGELTYPKLEKHRKNSKIW